MKPIIGTIRLILVCLILVVMYSLYLLKTMFIKHTTERGFALRRKFVHTIIKVLGIQVDFLGQPEVEKPALYVINHRSLVDPVIISAYFNVFFVSKAEVSSYPVLGAGAQKTGVIFVKRESKSSRSATLNAIKETFEKGENIGIYPEGTTNLYKLTKQYRLGSFKLAAEMGIPVIPVVLEYKDHKDLWNSKNMFAQFIKQFGPWKTYTKLIVGEAITEGTGEKMLEKAQAFTDKTLEEIHENWSTMKFEGLREPQITKK